MGKFTFVTIVLIFSNIYSQSKKTQINNLNLKIDSLNEVIYKSNLKTNKVIDSLENEIFSINKKLNNYEKENENQLRIKNNFIIELNSKIRSCIDQSSKQRELILLFNEAHSMEDRKFDAYKDSKLFSQIFFLRLLYHFDKIEANLGSTYYGVVLGNRLINANPTEEEKQIFTKEINNNLDYFIDNFTQNNDQKKEFKEMLKKEKITFDVIVNQLNNVRDWFEPYNLIKKYYLINSIDRILNRIDDKDKWEEQHLKLKID